MFSLQRQRMNQSNENASPNKKAAAATALHSTLLKVQGMGEFLDEPSLDFVPTPTSSGAELLDPPPLPEDRAARAPAGRDGGVSTMGDFAENIKRHLQHVTYQMRLCDGEDPTVERALKRTMRELKLVLCYAEVFQQAARPQQWISIEGHDCDVLIDTKADESRTLALLDRDELPLGRITVAGKAHVRVGNGSKLHTVSLPPPDTSLPLAAAAEARRRAPGSHDTSFEEYMRLSQPTRSIEHLETLLTSLANDKGAERKKKHHRKNRRSEDASSEELEQTLMVQRVRALTEESIHKNGTIASKNEEIEALHRELDSFRVAQAKRGFEVIKFHHHRHLGGKCSLRIVRLSKDERAIEWHKRGNTKNASRVLLEDIQEVVHGPAGALASEPLVANKHELCCSLVLSGQSRTIDFVFCSHDDIHAFLDVLSMELW